MQEIVAHMVAYNAAARLACLIPEEKKDNQKHVYAVDFKMVAQIFRTYYRKRDDSPEIQEEMLSNMMKYRQPIRKGRKDIRHMRFHEAVYFVYRVA